MLSGMVIIIFFCLVVNLVVMSVLLEGDVFIMSVVCDIVLMSLLCVGNFQVFGWVFGGYFDSMVLLVVMVLNNSLFFLG